MYIHLKIGKSIVVVDNHNSGNKSFSLELNHFIDNNYFMFNVIDKNHMIVLNHI